jgi:phosphoribosylaminoimidazole-succinocarboxamide synthase
MRSALPNTIDRIAFDECRQRFSGKVRENFVFSNGAMAIVVTDRVSVFDYKIGTIPYKGQVLNQLAAWWFRKLDDIAVPHHLISVPHPNVSVVRCVTALPIEMIMRAYLTGTTTTSSWYAYQHHDRQIGGLEMPPGMRKNEQFPVAISTPTTKATSGHDVNISKSEILRRGLVTEEVYEAAEQCAVRMFAFGQHIARDRGLILVDTKYEFGLTDSGQLIVIDEVHTPDSSRYWLSESYDARMNAGDEPDNLDKEFVRRAIVDAGYDVDSDVEPAQFFTDAVRIDAAEKYVDLFEKVTGETLNVGTTSEPEITKILREIAIGA